MYNMKRVRTIASFYQVASNQESNEIIQNVQIGTNLNENENNQESLDVGTAQNNMESIDSEIVGDPGLRKPIEELDVNIRDVVRREYLLLGPCQPKGHIFPKKRIGDRQRSFQESWFKKHEWLEYSVAKDAAFCFYCFLFKQPRRENFGVESYTGATGYNNRKNAIKSFDVHVGNIDSAHNKARRCFDDFKNQIQSVSHVMSQVSRKQEEEYLRCLIIVLGVIRFLLLQGLAFRGHDECTSSNNRGNFLEMFEWYKMKDSSAKKLFDSTPKNCMLTSPEIQNQICEACAEETKKVILAEIGDKKFAIIIDEA
jgi:hypothetical protein